MTELKVEIPERLEEEMAESPEENWQVIALEAIRLRVFGLELEKARKLRHLLFKTLISKSKFTEKDALELGKKIKESMFKDLKSEGWI